MSEVQTAVSKMRSTVSNFINDNHISRARANSTGSVPDVPYNTPETQSVVNDNASVVSSDVNIMIDSVSQDGKTPPHDRNLVTEQTGNERDDLNSPLKNMILRDNAQSCRKSESLSPLPDKAIDNKSLSPKCNSRINSPKGVMEHADWHDDIEQDLDRDLTRLANLAEDDHQRDPRISAADHYNKRLNLLLNQKHRRFQFDEHGQTSPNSCKAEPASPLKMHSIHPYRFDQLSAQVEEVTRLLRDVIQERMQEKEEFLKLKRKVNRLSM